MALIDLANPTRFLNFAERVLPWLTAATLFAFAIGLEQALFVAPDDYQQGATVKIMFLHVPCAWLSMFCWGVMTIASLGTLVWRHPLADVAAKAAAPIGAAFTFLFFTLHVAAMRNEILRRRVRSMQMLRARTQGA